MRSRNPKARDHSQDSIHQYWDRVKDRDKKLTEEDVQRLLSRHDPTEPPRYFTEIKNLRLVLNAAQPAIVPTSLSYARDRVEVVRMHAHDDEGESQKRRQHHLVCHRC